MTATMSDDLDQKSDQDISVIFAEEIVGWTKIRLAILGAGGGVRHPTPHGYPPGKNYEAPVHPFCKSADAVLPWLEKLGWIGTSGGEDGAAVRVLAGSSDKVVAEAVAIAPTFTRAACIALIRANRHEKSHV